MSEIPIKNLYYLVLYAFNEMKRKDLLGDKNIDKTNTGSKLLIELFLVQVSKIIKNGIFKSYNTITDEALTIKGQVDIAKTFQITKPKIVMLYDEFNEDNQYNQILKKTMHNILLSNLSVDILQKVKRLYAMFSEVQLVNDIDYNQKFNRVNEAYRFPLALAYLINEKVIPDSSNGDYRFIDILKDNETMSNLYEAFLRNFYRIHTDYKVSSRVYKWDLIPIKDSDFNKIPIMKTDVELVKGDLKIIIDAKYSKKALDSRYETLKFTSNNMYQIKTYLDHNRNYDNLRGILIYPSNGYEFNEKYDFQNKYTIELATVDLSQDWPLIENRLLEIIN
ncbi:5-methylcytosine restriction system specificity protein McrC [Liberiplasma polymorphum]|uniref:5-methylcytosine restriction system specificity protein McrC n=1 Tax=Liberiplasma polymorphum TaxID=3374570 RepID=UPI003775667E